MSIIPVNKTVVALGFFDGVHKGHAQLINMAKKRALEIGASPAVLSFDVSPESIVTGYEVPLIGSMETRADIIKRFFDVEDVIFCHFDKAIMTMPWKDFIDFIVSEYGAVHVVIGHDFRCGYKGEGNPEKISAYCSEIGLGCDIIPKFTLDGITVSSTYIRGLIAGGDIARANYFLGHPYIFAGIVSKGHKVGRKIGSPTINLKCPNGLILPANGVYATQVYFCGRFLPSVTNVGVRPTFGGKDEISIETYILDFEGDLYGEYVSIEFYEFLRSEQKFCDAEELKVQIKKDCKAAIEVLSSINL